LTLQRVEGNGYFAKNRKKNPIYQDESACRPGLLVACVDIEMDSGDFKSALLHNPINSYIFKNRRLTKTTLFSQSLAKLFETLTP